MPIDASSDPYDGTVGFDPASSKFDVDDLDDVADSKIDEDFADDDLESAGTGAGTVDLDLGGIDKGAPLVDDDLSKDLDVDLEKDFDVDLDDAGTGAKLDPSLGLDDDDVDIGIDVGAGDVVVKDLDLDVLDDVDDLEGTGIKGLVGVDLDDDLDLGPDTLHSHVDHDDDHDVKDDDLLDID